MLGKPYSYGRACLKLAPGVKTRYYDLVLMTRYITKEGGSPLFHPEFFHDLFYVKGKEKESVLIGNWYFEPVDVGG